ncbi:MAG: glycoside hydrolase family 95 protein [Bacteroidota bacterium]|nr:alpha-L-fucosidase [Odoribacter sp.]MDP3643446.1 glycoside hydrolase family 95 protein [Bacteroidota bacterium]
MKIKPLLLFLILTFICTNFSSAKETTDKLKLWYTKPAQKWTEALPIGNGRLGAMIFGGVENDRIQFNEETLWNGAPNDYAHKGAVQYLHKIRQLLFDGRQREAEELAMAEFMSAPLKQKTYQAFGDLNLHFQNQDSVVNYHRELNLKNAVQKVSYHSKGIKYTREYFASNPDQVIAIRLTADQKKALNFTLDFDALHESKTIKASGNCLTLKVQVKDGILRGVASLKVVSDGTVSSTANQLSVSGAKTATIYLAATTNYINYKDVSGNPEQIVNQTLAKLENRKYEQIHDLHIADYQKLFNRFDVQFSENERSKLPTNERIVAFSKEANDPQLLALYIQYGRYLLISSSRPGTQPANLQGIWNDQLAPAWDSKWTVNINTEMNYWPVEVANLAECQEPLYSMIADCAETGKIVAREHYNAPGWVLHHNTDIWRGAAPINNSNHGIWVTGGAWLSRHLWEHYLFSQDKQFLAERAYPLMKGAAEFFTQFLIKDPKTGYLISTPSNSPENEGLVAGPSMDHQIIRALFRSCIDASEILGTDVAFASKLKEMLPKIAPNQIGKHGQLQEWMEDRDDPANKHRHVSHLWGVHPGTEINWKETPELMKAARQSLIYRGDDGTGWSLAWKINFWARFLDGNHAYEMVKLLFRPVQIDDVVYTGGGGSYTNLFDAHPPFQIDGNFGAPAGMIEMLVQSHLNEITILPALPDDLPSGKISGVCARGGFELTFIWNKGKLQKLEVLSKAGQKCSLKYGEKVIEMATEKGKVYSFDGELKRL